MGTVWGRREGEMSIGIVASVLKIRARIAGVAALCLALSGCFYPLAVATCVEQGVHIRDVRRPRPSRSFIARSN
jgi:hypothetical protein